MKATAARLQDVIVFEPQPVFDDRGFFTRTLSLAAVETAGLHTDFVEESQSRSRHAVLRGLHGRSALTEGKLVRCARGEIFEVVLDIRPWSKTFAEWESFVLDDRDHRQVWVPPGMVHGFEALSDYADVCYRMDAVYDPSLDIAIAWNDPTLGIPWPISDPTLSDRDRRAPTFAEVRPFLEQWFGSERPTDLRDRGSRI